MVGVLFSNVLDAKVVNDKGEKYGLGFVLPQRWGSGYRGKTELGKVSFESFVGNAASLLEAGHAFSDLEVDLDVGTERVEAVMLLFCLGCRLGQVSYTRTWPWRFHSKNL